jgi:hypothetical protein
MPRFYFHLYNDDVVTDEEGRELPDAASARAEALREAREMMTDEVLKGKITLSHRIEVADENGAPVATIAFRDALDVKQ